MSRTVDKFLRKQPWKFRGKDPATGRNFCFCGCGQVVGPRRSSSHSKECVDWWRSHSDMNHIRFVVERRDKGVCALCGRDTNKARAAWQQQLVEFGEQKRAAHTVIFRFGIDWHRVQRLYFDDPLLPRPPEGFPTEDRRWWEADHIIPVIEGGGGCGPEGYRTLCLPCHKAETKALAGRRAAKRKTVAA